MANSILEQAKQRVAEIERETAALNEEAAVLRRMIDAAENGVVQVAPAPAPQIAPLPYPVPMPGGWPWPQPDPLTPWIVGPTVDHGGMCACSRCCPTIGTLRKAAVTLAPRFACNGTSTCGCGCNGFLWCATTATTAVRIPDGGVVLMAPTNGVRLDNWTTVRIGDPLGLPVDSGIRYTVSN